MNYATSLKRAITRIPRIRYPYGEQALFPDMRAAIAAKAAAYIASNPRPRASFITV